MASVTIYANQMAVISQNNTSLNRHGNETEYADEKESILVGFDENQIPKGAILQSIDLQLYAKATKSSGSTPYVEILSLLNKFDQNIVTWNTKPNEYSGDPLSRTAFPENFNWASFVSNTENYFDRRIEGIKNGFRIYESVYGANITKIEIKSAISAEKPKAVIQYNAPTVHVSPGFTDGIFIPKNIDKSVAWSIDYDSHQYMIGTPAQVSAEVRCKSGGTTKKIQVSGSATTATIPAGTFTESNGQIQIAISTTAGGYAESTWITVNNTDQTGTSVAVSPRGVKIDGDAEQVFSWTYESPTGTPQTKAELQVSYDGGGRWQELATAQGNVRQTTIQAGTLEAGAAAWRVRGFNSDGSPGEYSDGAYIIVSKRFRAILPLIVAQKARKHIGQTT